VYVQYPSLGLTLPRQLTPPSWLKDLIRQKIGAALKGTVVTVPTEAGTMSFDLSDPAALAALKKIASGIRVTRTPAAPAPGSPVAAIPGGWLTLGLVGVGLYLFASRGGGQRSARAQG